MFLCFGEMVKGLFHCFEVMQNDYEERFYKKGATVAIVENENGRIFRCSPNNIAFLDTKEQMKQFIQFKNEVNENG
jgi:hypothetical protein